MNHRHLSTTITERRQSMKFPETIQLQNIHYQNNIAIAIMILFGIILIILLNRILITILTNKLSPLTYKLKYSFTSILILFIITSAYNIYLTKQLYQPNLQIKHIIDTHYGTNLLVTENTKFLSYPYISYKENKKYRIFDDQKHKIDIYYLKIKDYHIYLYDNHQKLIQPQ